MNHETDALEILEYDFSDQESNPEVPQYDNPDIYADPAETGKITVESDLVSAGPLPVDVFNMKDLPKQAIAYLKRNKLFLGILMVVWAAVGSYEYSLPIYSIPVIGGIYRFMLGTPVRQILIYLSTAYNGPVGFYISSGLNPYTFAVALTAKSAYVLAMTGVGIPAVRAIIRNRDAEIALYRENAGKLMMIFRQLTKNVRGIGFAAAGCGAAMVVSNLLTRNGKFDKTFILVLLSFVLFKGFNGTLPSVLDLIARRSMAVFTRMMPGGIRNGIKQYEQLRAGAILGFLLAIPVGSTGERSGYSLGIILFVAGTVISVIMKEKE